MLVECDGGVLHPPHHPISKIIIYNHYNVCYNACSVKMLRKMLMRKKREGLVLLMAQRRCELLRKWVESHTTQADLARKAGCTRQYVSWLMRTPFGFDAARSIEEKFGITTGLLEPDYLKRQGAENFVEEKGHSTNNLA